MTRLTLDEYRLEHDDADYPTRIASRPDVLQAFMIPFANPAFLAGPFGGSYGLVTIHDASRGPNRLHTETEAYNRFRRFASNNLYNMPRAKDGHGCLTTTHEYLRGRYKADTLEPAPMDDRDGTIMFSTRNTLPGSATLEHPFLEITTNSSSEIDGLDMLRLFRRMIETLPADEVVRRIENAEKRIESQISSYLENDARAEPTAEKPIVLRLQGNDDASWGRAFASVDEALEFADEIELSARGSRLPSGLAFTN